MKQKLEQIGCWMAANEKDDLEEYASRLQIDLCALGSLLLVKELSSKRLQLPSDKFKKVVPAKGRKRVTVHIGDRAFFDHVIHYLEEIPISANDAFGRLLRYELEERWLAKSCEIKEESA